MPRIQKEYVVYERKDRKSFMVTKSINLKLAGLSASETSANAVATPKIDLARMGLSDREKKVPKSCTRNWE